MRALVASFLLIVALPSPNVRAADYAPLECSKASTPAERTICRDYALGQQEARMATLFSVTTSLVAMGQRGNIQDAQRAWLKRREDCGDAIGCLTGVYNVRIAELNDVFKAIASRGPF